MYVLNIMFGYLHSTVRYAVKMTLQFARQNNVTLVNQSGLAAPCELNLVKYEVDFLVLGPKAVPGTMPGCRMYYRTVKRLC